MTQAPKGRILPRLWTGRRLLQCVMLVAAGITQASAALIMSLSAAAHMNGTREIMGTDPTLVLVTATAAAIVLAVIQLRYGEAFAASYVHALRMRYMTHVMLTPIDEPARNIGHVLTRVVNDMSAIKLWLSRGLVVFFGAVPMIATIGLWLVSNAPSVLPPILIAIAVWLVLTGAAIFPLSNAIRQTRRRRGGVAGFAGLAFSSRFALLRNGLLSKTLQGLEKRSQRLTKALVLRATWSGLMRSSGHVIFPVAVLLYLILPGVPGDVRGASSVTVFLMITAFVSAQLTVLSAGLEYYQGARIAYEKIEAILRAPAIEIDDGKRLSRADWRNEIRVDALRLADGEEAVSFTLPSSTISLLTGLGETQRQDLYSTLLGLTHRRKRAHISIGPRCLDTIDVGDIWRRVKMVSPQSMPDVRKEDIVKRSRLSAVNTSKVLQSFGLVETAGSHIDIAARLRAAQTLLCNPAIVILDDPEIWANSNLVKTLLHQLHKRGVMVLLGKEPNTAMPKGLTLHRAVIQRQNCDA